MKNKLGLGILIGVLVSLVIGLAGFIIYDKVLTKSDNVEQSENDMDDNSNVQQEVTLNYHIEGTTPNVKITVNNKYADITGTGIEVVGKLADVLVLKVWSFDFYDYYIVDKDANVLVDFTGKGAISSTNYKKIELKGNYPGDCTIENNTLIIKSDIVASDPTYNSCSKNDNDIVEYTEKFTYLGNGKFSNSILTKTTTAKEYIANNNIKCD